MKVFTKFKCVSGVGFRWRTLLQFGQSWEVIGSVVMKNPGSSAPQGDAMVKDEETLRCLSVFDKAEATPWYQFTVDDTMRCVGDLFAVYYGKQHRERLQGVIQVFNVFYVMNPDIEAAKQDVERLNDTIVDDDLNQLLPPVYLGFGDLWKDKVYKERCGQFYDRTKLLGMGYFADDFKKNSFTHPQRLMHFNRNRDTSLLELARFKQNAYDLSDKEEAMEKCKLPTITGQNQEDALNMINIIKGRLSFPVIESSADRLSYDIGNGMKVQITAQKQVKKGQYVSFRHINYKQNYAAFNYPNTNAMSAYLISLGYKSNNAWVGQKQMSEYYATTTEELADYICSEITKFSSWLEKDGVM